MKILLIDGHSMLNRAFYGLPDLTNSEGLHTGAVYGFLNIMLKTIEEEAPDHLAVAFDVHAPTFRHERYKDYKGTRKPMPQELVQQVPLIQQMLAAMGVTIVTLPGFEADDILGTLARRCEKEGMDVTILSGDRDLLQLATEKTKIRMPKTARGTTSVEDYYAADVLARYQVTPPQVIELKAFMGDSSDNIPGLPGVGEKTATKLVAEFGSIENAYKNLEQVKPKKAMEALRDHYDLAQLSKELATICTDAPLQFDLPAAKLGSLYTKEAYALCTRLEFKNLLSRFTARPEPDEAQEEAFFTIEDPEGLSAILGRFSGTADNKRPPVGLMLLKEAGEILGAGIALPGDGEEAYFVRVNPDLTGQMLTQKLTAFAKTCLVCAMDVKELLKSVETLDEDQVFDCGIAAYLLDPLKSDYPYDIVAKEFLPDSQYASREALFGRKKLLAAFQDEDPAVARYACYGALTALRCREPMLARLSAEGMLKIYVEIELPLVFTLDRMEKYGVKVKGEELKSYGEQLQKRIGELETEIYHLAGEEFNINSPRQLGVILFEKLGLPGGKKTKTGYSTAADVLEKLAPRQPLVSKILEYRQYTKLKSTYADGLAMVIAKDGRIHSTFNQTITATGRISSTEPNLQNIPVRMELGRLIRKVFVPEDGYVFLDADYSQIELRVLAHMSQDENLIEAYAQAKDIHAITASQVFHVPFDEVTPLMRRNAKAVNFGIVYGISSFGLSQDLSISRQEAQSYIENYFLTYPGIKAYLDQMVSDGKENGFVTTLFGRRRPIPELKSSNFMQRQFGERVAMNSPIQGTAADIIKIAMNRVRRRLEAEGLASRLVLQVHDELLIETKEEEKEQVARILEEEMKGAADLKVALDIDMHEGKNWYEAK